MSELLQRTRDLLLSRLGSGKLAVEHLDIAFPPGMAEDPPAPVRAQNLGLPVFTKTPMFTHT